MRVFRGKAQRVKQVRKEYTESGDSRFADSTTVEYVTRFSVAGTPAVIKSWFAPDIASGDKVLVSGHSGFLDWVSGSQRLRVRAFMDIETGGVWDDGWWIKMGFAALFAAISIGFIVHFHLYYGYLWWKAQHTVVQVASVWLPVLAIYNLIDSLLCLRAIRVLRDGLGA